MLKKLTIILAIVLAPVSLFGAKKSASQVINSISASLTKADAIEASFKIVQNGDQAISGTAFIQGTKFTLTLPQMRAWYDGKTQWTYSNETKEVSVIEPTKEELAETNPLSIISACTKGCKVRRLASAADVDKIEVTPAANSSFRKAVVTASASSNFLKEIVVTMNDGNTAAITFNTLKKAAKKPDSYFRFNKKLIPDAEIVDLR